MVVTEDRPRHPQRLEDVRLGEFPQGLAANSFDDIGQQRVAGVAVRMLITRFEIQLLHPRNQVQNVVITDHVFAQPPAGHYQQIPLVTQPAGVMQQMPNGDWLIEFAEFCDVFLHFVVQRKFALLGEQQNGKCCELFRHRSDVKRRVRPDRNVVIEVSHSVTAFVNDLAVFDHGQRAAGRIGFVVLSKHLVYLLRSNRPHLVVIAVLQATESAIETRKRKRACEGASGELSSS